MKHDRLNKLDALGDYIRTVQKGWTWKRMTETEQTAFIDLILETREQDAIKGDYTTRWTILNALYGAFLDGLGYDGPAWREPEAEAE